MTDRDKLVLGVKEVAERLSLSTSEVYRMIQRGVLPAVRYPDMKGTFVRATDLTAWVRALAKAEAEK